MDKVYLETTIPSYLVSKPSRDIVILGHQELTREWWQIEKDHYELYISEVVLEEISRGNQIFIDKRMELIKDVRVLRFNDEIESIAAKYMKNFNFPDKLVRDIFHIAYCVFYEIDFLLTWNCKHIANAHFRIQLERYNKKIGYKTPVICTPEELVEL